MPHVIVKLWPVKTSAQKQALSDAIVRDIAETLGCGNESVSVGFEEVSSADWLAEVYGPDIKGRRHNLTKQPGYAPRRPSTMPKVRIMILEEAFTLANGVRIPKLGYGTWMIPDGDTSRAVNEALAIGYRHIDTAQAYANERGVGEGVRNSGISRDEVFITSKLAAESKRYADAKERIDGSLQALGLDHIDLMLIHSPQPWAEFRQGNQYYEGNAEAWRALEEAHQSGKLRAIGVSNFERADIENLLTTGSVAPMVNQVLAHVGNTPFDLLEYCRFKGILVEAYSQVAHGAMLKDAGMQAMAERYGVSVARLCIRYCLQLDLLPLPKTLNPAHMRDNAAVDFAISDTDMEALRGAQDGTDYGEAGKFPVFGKKRQAEPPLQR